MDHLRFSLLLFILSFSAIAQTSGTVKGQVTDATGASIPGASVTVAGPGGYNKALSTDAQGAFAVTGLAPGKYTVTVNHFGFAQFQSKPLTVGAGQTANLPVALQLQAQKQEVNVTSETTGTVSTDPAANAGQLVLKAQDLESLPDDPDDLASDLQALAGPAAGPNGGQIYIDGFTGGTLPPKNAIREIRINQNPFSAEYDQLGFGRIEILTKPGSDKFHGSVFFNDSDSVFNARNPFLVNSAPLSGATTTADLTPSFQSRLYGGNVGGPINGKASFFFDFLRREIDDNAIVNAVTLDNNLIPNQLSQAFPTPNRFTDLSGRIDYQLSTNNTLVTRYSYEDRKASGAGIGNFTLPSRAYDSLNAESRVQMTETAVINPRVVNETRFQFLNDLTSQNASNDLPAINVLQSFNGGGAQVGRTYDREQHYELQNSTSFSWRAHSLKAGVRIRSVVLDNGAPNNFGGTFTFAGGQGPELDANNQPVLDASGQPVMERITSTEQYRRTLLFQSLGLPFSQIQALGGGASQFSISGGNPFASLNQTDAGIYFTDDWKVKPNFTLSLGLRYEIQNNIHDHNDWAPRVSFAWAPGSAGKNGQGKWVIRAGSGFFYTRVQDTLYLNALRYNGINQVSYTIDNPGFYLNGIPPLSTLSSTSPLVRNIFDNNLRAPYLMQTAIGLERQLPWHTTLAINYLNSRSIHLLRTRNINAPLDGTYDPSNPSSGIRPFGTAGSIYQYESDGIMKQNQIIVNVNSRVNSNLSLFGYYTYGRSFSNTDTVATFPADEYNLSQEWGRSSFDIRHKVFFGGSVATKYGIRLSPFMVFNSGRPFNITTGRDLNGDLQFTDRPSFAPASSCGQTNIVCTAFGDFNLNPAPGATLIPRNYANGPSFFSLNLRLAKTWGFGEATSRPSGGGRGGRGGGGGGGGGGRGGGGAVFGGGGGRGGGDMFGGGSSNQRYQLTLSIFARNLLNTVNDADFTGNLTSPYFGRANALYSGFGGGGGGGGGGNTNNRRLELGLRFTF